MKAPSPQNFEFIRFSKIKDEAAYSKLLADPARRMYFFSLGGDLYSIVSFTA